MTTALTTTTTTDATLIERVLLHGDLRQLSPAQKVSYYNAVCESVGLNPLTQPFQYLVLSGKEVLYARRDATEQLRKIHSVSVQIMAREVMEDCYIVTARATLPNGRQDENIGAVPIAGLKGEARANAMMKAETKAKRRVTLAICGLGMLDETEVESIPGGYTVEPAPAPRALPGERETSVGRAGGDIGHSSEQHPTGNVKPDSDVELPDGAVLIQRVEIVDTKNPNVKKCLIYTVGGNPATLTSEVYSTIKPQLASQAEQCCQNRTPVYIEGKATKWGLDCVGITVSPPAAEIAATKWN